jgi:hypothetical protein
VFEPTILSWTMNDRDKEQHMSTNFRRSRFNESMRTSAIGFGALGRLALFQKLVERSEKGRARLKAGYLKLCFQAAAQSAQPMS